MVRVKTVLVLACLVGQIALLGHTISCHNVTIDETSHILAGVLYVRRGTTDFYEVNPPLARAVAALPLTLLPIQLPEAGELEGSERLIAWSGEFQVRNASHWHRLVVSARLSLVLWYLLGAGVVTYWAGALFGRAAAVIALALWITCPNLTTWASVVTTDLAAAVGALTAVLSWRWYFQAPSCWRALVVGLCLGLALLTKFSLLALVPLLVILSLADPRSRWSHGLLWIGVTLAVVNAGYFFRGTGRALGTYDFHSALLTGEQFGRAANRFRGTVLEHLPIPLPQDYVSGVDVQKAHSDSRLNSDLCGEWRRGGWWYYYLIAMAVKVPLGTWLLGGMAAALACCSRRYRASAQEEWLIWLLALALLTLVSSQTGINGHFRYALPVLPFVCIGVSRAGKLLEEAWLAWREPLTGSRRRLIRWSLGACLILGSLAWNAVAVARTHPHYLSYFNEIAGGPDNGWKWLAESNIDWGQDLLFLKDWLARHPDAARSLKLAYYGGIATHLLGLNAPPIPWEEGPKPGWFAVSANAVTGMAFIQHDLQGPRRFYPPNACRYFQEFTPIAKAGYSIFIYHITLDEVNAVWQRMGLPPLTNERHAAGKETG
jgi:hypothetical protein